MYDGDQEDLQEKEEVECHGFVFCVWAKIEM